jgi:FHS family glucose/mannose:H+ symporter-like MFS transporter
MNYLLWVSFLSLFILGFGDNIRGPLFPEIIQSFGLTDSLAAWYFAVSSFMSFVGSYMVRKFKSVSELLKLLYSGVLCIFISFSIQRFASNYAVVLCGVVFFGLSVGFLGVAQNNLVIIGTSPKDRPRKLSYLHSMYGIASLLAPLFVAWLADHRWQQILFSFSWVALIFGLGGIYYNSKKTERIQHFAQFQQAEAHGLSSWSELKIILAISFYVLAEIVMGTRLALFMRRYYNYDLSASSLYVTLFFVFLLVGRVIVSFLPHHFGIKKQLLLSLVASFVLILIGLYLHPLALPLAGLGLAPFYPLSMAYISQLYPHKSTTIVSWALTIQGLCIVLMHLGVGQLADWVGLKSALLIGPVCCLLSFIILLFIRENKNV